MWLIWPVAGVIIYSHTEHLTGSFSVGSAMLGVWATTVSWASQPLHICAWPSADLNPQAVKSYSCSNTATVFASRLISAPHPATEQ